MNPVLDVLSAVLLLAGALQCLLGAVGVVRLPSLLSRMQAATKPQTLGLLLILAGAALRVPLDSAVTLLLVAVFQVITAPVISHLIGRAGYRSGAVRPEKLVVDELAPRMAPEDRPDPVRIAMAEREADERARERAGERATGGER